MKTKTCIVRRTLRSYLEKKVTVPADTHEDDVVEAAWASDDPWVPNGSRDIDCEVERE